MLYVFFKTLLTIPYWILYRPRVKGLRHLFRRGKAIFISNHHDLGDPIHICFIAPRCVHFMAKQELFVNRFVTILMRGFLTFPVYRKHADLASLKEAMRVLDTGKAFGIFPEGRRSITGELDEFEKGAAFLALRCNAPIIPLYSDPFAPRRLRTRVIVGEPMDASAIAAAGSGRPVDVVTAALHDRMQALKNEMAGWDRL